MDSRGLLGIYIAFAAISSAVVRIPLKSDSVAANILVTLLVFTTALFAWLFHKEKRSSRADYDLD